MRETHRYESVHESPNQADAYSDALEAKTSIPFEPDESMISLEQVFAPGEGEQEWIWRATVTASRTEF